MNTVKRKILMSVVFSLAFPLGVRTQNIVLEHPERNIAFHDFVPLPHFPPVNQDSTLVCWSFATTSFLESELMRLCGKEIKLSVFYPVYYRLLEKSKSYLVSGDTLPFSPGDLFMGVFEVIEQYGIVPASAYEGEKNTTTFYNHTALYRAIDSLLAASRKLSLTERIEKVQDIKILLNNFLGIPPTIFKFENTVYSPLSFRDSVVQLPWDEYIMVASFRYAPYYTFIELKVPDNWRHSSRFYNVPLELFVKSMKEALRNHVTVVIDADITESSYERDEPWCRIFSPTQTSSEQRERMFQNGETTDDHLMHVVAYAEKDGEGWFLAKDSWRTAWKGNQKGYKFFHSSYCTYKVLSFLTHREALFSLKDFLPQR